MEQYSIIHTYIKQFIEQYLDNENIIKLIPDDDSLMPHVNKKTFEIKYSYRSEILVLLYNCKTSTLLLNYYLAATCYLNNDFEDAKFFIEKLHEGVKSEGTLLKDRFPSEKYRIVNQMLFMVLHEIAHGQFYRDEEQKKFFYGLVDDDIKQVSEMYGKILSLPFMNLFLKRKISQKSKGMSDDLGFEKKEIYSFFGVDNIKDTIADFPNYVADPRKKEELACDLYALRVFQQVMEQLNIAEKDYAVFYSAELNGLQFLSRYNWWDNYIVKQMSSEQRHKKNFIDPLRAIFFYNECAFGREKFDSKINDYLLENNEVPFIDSYYEVDFVEKIRERLKLIGEGVIKYSEEEKAETYEKLLDVEDEILNLVAGL